MKKIMSCFLLLAFCVGMSLSTSNSVKAADLPSNIEENAENNQIARGVYLGSGSSSISEAGTGKIAAGGTTIGQRIVSNISVNVRVERLVNGSWEIYTSWSATRYNAASVSSSKTLSVPRGYYYRTHCSHIAYTDASGSVSGGVWIN